MSKGFYLGLLLTAGLFMAMQSMAQTVAWPQNIQNQADKITGIVEQSWSYPPRMINELKKLAESFDAEMATLAKFANDDLVQKAQDHESADPTAKLILLAQYSQNNKQRIEQIASRFSQADQRRYPSRVAPKPPKISSEWVASSDRLAWEYLSLRPKGGDNAFYVRRIGEGIASIADPASVLTVSIAFQSTLTADALPGRNRQTFQQQMIETLAHMPNSKSLQALMNIEKQIQAAPEFKGAKDQSAEWRTSNKALIGFTGKALKSYISDEEKTKWKAVFQEFSSQVPSTELQNLKNLQRNLEIKR
jgi:hypothetical protein